jgi:hypothetical protein
MGKIQVTPTSRTVLQGDGREMAVQLCQKVIDPLLMAMVERDGPHAVVQFYAALVAHLAMDMQEALGTVHAEHVMHAALKATHGRPKVPGIFERGLNA